MRNLTLIPKLLYHLKPMTKLVFVKIPCDWSPYITVKNILKIFHAVWRTTKLEGLEQDFWMLGAFFQGSVIPYWSEDWIYYLQKIIVFDNWRINLIETKIRTGKQPKNNIILKKIYLLLIWSSLVYLEVSFYFRVFVELIPTLRNQVKMAKRAVERKENDYCVWPC